MFDDGLMRRRVDQEMELERTMKQKLSALHANRRRSSLAQCCSFVIVRHHVKSDGSAPLLVRH